MSAGTKNSARHLIPAGKDSLLIDHFCKPPYEVESGMNSKRFHRANKMMPRNSRTAPAVLPYVVQMNAACSHNVAIRVDSCKLRMTNYLVHRQTVITLYLHDSPPTHSSYSFQKCHLHMSIWFERETGCCRCILAKGCRECV